MTVERQFGEQDQLYIRWLSDALNRHSCATPVRSYLVNGHLADGVSAGALPRGLIRLRVIILNFLSRVLMIIGRFWETAPDKGCQALWLLKHLS